MPSWHVFLSLCVAFGLVVYLKRVLDSLDRERPVDETDVRLWRLKHERMARGECIYCGTALSDGRTRSTLTSSVCGRCAPPFDP